MVIPKFISVTDAAGHSETVGVREIEKIVRDPDEAEAVLYFKDGRTLPVEAESADRLLKRVPELERGHDVRIG